MSLQLSVRKIIGALAGIVIVLTVANLLTQLHKHDLFPLMNLFDGDRNGTIRLFDADREGNYPTFYSAAALLFCALLAAAIARLTFLREGRFVRLWALLAAILAYISADEVGMLHERVGQLLRSWGLGGGIFHFVWVVPFLVLTVIVGLIYLRFLAALPRRTGRLFVLAGVLYVSGAIGFEMLGGARADAAGQDNLLYALIISAEELLEMVGVLVLAYALLTHLAELLDGSVLVLANDTHTLAAADRRAPTRPRATAPPHRSSG